MTFIPHFSFSVGLHETLVIFFQLLIADPLDFLFLLSGQLFPDGLVYLDHTQGFGMVKHLYILEPLEGVGQDIPLGLGIGAAALGIDAGGLFHYQTSRPACFVELPEVGTISLSFTRPLSSANSNTVIRSTGL